MGLPIILLGEFLQLWQMDEDSMGLPTYSLGFLYELESEMMEIPTQKHKGHRHSQAN